MIKYYFVANDDELIILLYFVPVKKRSRFVCRGVLILQGDRQIIDWIREGGGDKRMLPNGGLTKTFHRRLLFSTRTGCIGIIQIYHDFAVLAFLGLEKKRYYMIIIFSK